MAESSDDTTTLKLNGNVQEAEDIPVDIDDSQTTGEAGDGSVLDESIDPCCSSSVVITNLPTSLFTDTALRKAFEMMFSRWDQQASFSYWRSFRRVVIKYSTPEGALCARRYHSETDVQGTLARCYLLQDGRTFSSGSCSDENGLLKPPAVEKLFLISPPASPPVDWRPVPESEPVPNYDLLSAVIGLTPGECHEVHQGAAGQPSIVVHVADETDRERQQMTSGRDLAAGQMTRPLKIIQTRCPSR